MSGVQKKIEIVEQTVPVLEVAYKNDIKEVIRDCQAGKREAQFKLYNEYSKSMYNTAVRILKDHSTAEDVLQESFISMFRSLHTFRGEAPFEAWLRRIVVNKSLNAIRARKRLVFQDDEKWEDLPTEATPNLDDSLFPYSVEQVNNAIQNLPDGYRIVFTMFLLDGFSHKEIAEQLGITETTSKTQYHRAKHKIRNWLTEHYGQN